MMNLDEARGLAQTIVLSQYADQWKKPKAFLHDAIAKIILQAVHDTQTEQEVTLNELKMEAWQDRDLERFEFYNGLTWELRKLHAVGRACAGLYQNGGDEKAWNAMFEALFDAGLLDIADESDSESEADS